jgi:leader peptidase (prepilin peptidase)/N-methyltransferase
MEKILVALLASFLSAGIVNYLADVLPRKRSLAKPFCIKCQADFPWMNYLIWPRRCQNCSSRRGIRVLVVEFCLLVSSLYLVLFSPQKELGFWLSYLLFSYFALVVVIDVEHRLILHSVSIVGFFIALVVGVLLHGIVQTIIGGGVGYLSMMFLYFVGIAFVRLSSKYRAPTDEVALGFGDVNLSGVVGLLLGWPGIGVGLVLTIILSGIVSLGYILIMLVRRQYRSDLAIPFGPFLVASAVLLLFFKSALIELWGLH